MQDGQRYNGSMFQQNIGGCLEGVIGQFGLAPSAYASWLDSIGSHVKTLKDDYREKRLPLLRIAEEEQDIVDAEAALAHLSEGAKTLVFFGTGGSSLGGETLAQLADWNISGVALPGQRNRLRIQFYANLDGGTLQSVLEALDLTTSRFVVTSKSGGTAETLAQAIVTLTAMKVAGLETQIPKLFLGITEPDKPGKTNGLRTLFSEFAIPMLEHHPGIGGRFSCLTNVGLIPAIACGLDARAIRAGAKSVVDSLMAATSVKDFGPAVGAATAVALSKEKGISTLVMMPYADKLGRLSAWFVQLWAESLGKGGEGTKPIGALGPLDQHSQLQLFMDGPHDHYLTILRVASNGIGPRIDPELARIAGADMLGGHTVGDIVTAQSYALPEALGRAGRPVRTIDITKLDEKTIGALLMHFMIETILTGRLLRLDPFDQPAVELAKILTKERLVKGA